VRADKDKMGSFVINWFVYGADIAGNVYTSVSFIFTMQLVVVQNTVKFV
jgi:hypothetical protein